MNQRRRPDGISRRAFVQGRFGRLLGLGGSEKPPPRRVSLVMRYPKTLDEVAEADSESSPEETIAPPTESAARRRMIAVFRPPGAIDEASFLQGCTKCNECAKACPHDAIAQAPPRMREAAGTPMIEADHQACMMCEDFPCIAACEPGVLSSSVPPLMGTAKITEHLCLTHHSTMCTVCSERCPVSGAIELADGKPIVNENACTGCGVCRYVCPAPENAILLMPAFHRPSPSK